MRHGDVARIAGIGLASALSAASLSSPGERAENCPDDLWVEEQSCWPTCPEGEVCSGRTPEGLYFATLAWTDDDGTPLDGVKATAQGGVQTVRVLTGRGLGSQPFDLPFEAVSSDATILTVLATAGPDVAIAGVAPGSAYLRIVEPVTGKLYDRILVGVTQPSCAWLAPCPFSALWPSCTDVDEGFDEGLAWGILAGVPTDVRVDLGAVDEAMALESYASARGEQRSWDTIRVQATEPVVIIRAFSGDADLRAELRVLDRVDSIEWTASRTFGAATKPPGEGYDIGGVYCFRAMSGEYAVVGTNWAFGASGALVLAAWPVDLPANCVYVGTRAEGEGSLTVTTGGVVRSYSVTVGAADRAAPARSARPGGQAGAPGERAQLGLPEV